MLNRLIIPLFAVATLAGCASTGNDAAEALAKSRAATINQNAPYAPIDQYRIMKAKAKEGSVELTILYGGGGKVTPNVAAKSAAANFCNNEELTPLFEQGVNYKLSIMDMQGRKLAQQTVNAEYCAGL